MSEPQTVLAGPGSASDESRKGWKRGARSTAKGAGALVVVALIGMAGEFVGSLWAR